jgi:hypothetical protein
MSIGKEATCIYCMSLKQPLRPVTLAYLHLVFLALMVVDALHFLVVKEDTV